MRTTPAMIVGAQPLAQILRVVRERLRAMMSMNDCASQMLGIVTGC